MTNEQSMELKKGDKVCFKVGRNEYMVATFVRHTEITTYSRTTFEEVFAGVNPFRNPRTVKACVVEVINDYGKPEIHYIPVRRLIKYF